MSNVGTLKVTARGDREIVLSRVFDAPRAQVFDALTKPELLKQWFGPRAWSLVVCDVDLRVGGSYRFVLRNKDGAEMGMGGTYREIARPERLVHTEIFDNWHAGESVVTTTLVEENGKTSFTGVVLYPTPEIRDEVVKSPMEKGVTESYQRLEELLVSSAGRAA